MPHRSRILRNGDYSPVHFTAKERDGGNTLSPTNLDNFGARFYSSSLARFMSPDWAAKPTAVPYASFGNPQSLNLYSYVKNNPVTTRDPDGHCDPGLNCLETNFKAGLGQIENAAKAAAVVTVGTIGAGVGEVVAGVESGNGNEITQGLDKIGATVTVLAVGAESGGETAEGEGTVTRYMGADEAAKSETSGFIPNVDREGNPRPTHVTTDPPMDSAAGAKQKYELSDTPTHRATVPAGQAGELGPTPDGKPRTSGGGSQAATNNPIPVKPHQIKPLNQ